MPGVVKVGKTNRNPIDRANELSGVTGVPTPFIVAFEQLFDDCDAAENCVHAQLERMGYRMSRNREFFNAPVNTVIRAIMSAPGRVDDNVLSIERFPHDNLLSDADDDLSRMDLGSYQTPNAWDAILSEAEEYQYGYGDRIQDHVEALRLYKQAANLGSLQAYKSIGDMYRYGEGAREDYDKALKYYKEGVKRGNYYCYMAMAALFAEHQHENNFRKCVDLFFNSKKDKILLEIDNQYAYAYACYRYIRLCIRYRYKVEYLDELREQKDDIINTIRNLQGDGINWDDLEEVQQWISNNL